MNEDLGLLITAATDAADDAKQHRDYRGKYVHIGRGLIYTGTALANAINRFAAAIEPKENP